MIVSHAHRFIFFHNPKCAGTSFREAIAGYHDDPFTFSGILPAPFFCNQLDYMHIRLWELQQLFPHLLDRAAEYASVIFVRSPHLRFLSAVDQHFRQYQPNVRLPEWPPEEQARIVEEFATNVLRVPAILADYRFVHFSPQLWHIALGPRIVPRAVIPLLPGRDSFGRACRHLGIPPVEVPWRNPSAARLGHALERPAVARFIRGFYAADLEFFASHPDFAPLCEPPASRDATPMVAVGAQ